MPASQPRPDLLKNLVERKPEGSLYMLNLLKFREKAVYSDGRETDQTGTEAYQEIHVHRDAGLEHQILVNCLDLEQTIAALKKA